MSANNQILVKEYKGKWYVFGNIMAESWVHYDSKTESFDESRTNELSLQEAVSVHDTRDGAYEAALKFQVECAKEGLELEYGVQFNRLCKDDAEVKIIEE